MKQWQFWLGVIISIALMVLALRGLRLGDVWQALLTARYGWLIPGVAVYFLGVWVRAWRWHYLLRPVKAIPTKTMFPIVAIGYMGNNIYPARAGEILRAVVLKRREAVPISASLATIIVERVYDGVVMLAFVFLNLPELARLTADSGFVGDIQSLALWGAAAFVGVLVVFLLAAMFPQVTERVIRWAVSRFVPGRLREKFLDVVLRFLGGLESLRSPREALMVFITSVVIWLFETGKYWFVMHAFDFQVSFFALMLMNGIVNLATTIPSAPGYVGTFDAPGIAVLKAYGVDGAIAASYTLVLHVALWLPITLLGAYYLAKEGVKWGEGLGTIEMSVRPTDQSTCSTRSNAMNVAIIGAGIAGMSASYDLARFGHQVTLYEASQQVGGLASGFKEPHWDWSVEKYYHHWFASDKHMLGLIEELGLSHKVLFPRPYTVLLHNEKWHPFDSILQASLFPGLGWGFDKIRFGFAGLYLRLTRNWQPLEKVTAHEWMLKWVGKRVYEKMWQPLLVGKFGRYYEEVPMAWFWARLHVRTTRLGTYQGGFQAFCDDFADKLRALGVDIHLDAPLARIQRIDRDGLFRLTADRRPPTNRLTDQPTNATYDKVLVTTSPTAMANLAPDLPGEYLQSLLSLKSMGAVVLTLSLKRRLSEQGYYWYNIPKNAGYPFLALVEHTNFVSPEHFGGDHIVYCGDYLEADHEYFDLTQEELLERFIPALKRFNPQFQPNWIRKSWLHRARYAQPVPLVNHSQNIPSIETPIEGLYFASMSQVYPWDRGTNFAVEIGRRAAELIATEKIK